MQEEKLVLVQTDLLLQEKGFEELRKCITHLDLTELKLYDEFCYDLDREKVVIVHQSIHPYISNINFICQEIQNGYIFTDLTNLKKILSVL